MTKFLIPNSFNMDNYFSVISMKNEAKVYRENPYNNIGKTNSPFSNSGRADEKKYPRKSAKKWRDESENFQLDHLMNKVYVSVT